jgi:amino acid adenylation domain-containing protein
MPFETLVRALEPERYLNHNPLFDVMFIYHDAPQIPSFGNELELAHEPFDLGITKFDLTLYISDLDDRIDAVFEYSKDLFEESTVERMHGHFTNLLEGIVSDPDRSVAELEMIGAAELEQIAGWNGKPAAVVKPSGIHKLFEEEAALNPGAAAVRFKDQELTYGELDKKAGALAAEIIKFAPDPSRPIGLFTQSSFEMIIGIFGILKAGFAYLPLDAGYPDERIDLLLEDSSASIVLTQEKLLERIERRPGISAFAIEELTNDNAGPDKPAVYSAEVRPGDPAYVIYTSGSTGVPKGVIVTHGNLLHSTAARFSFYSDSPKNFLLLSSFSFDSSVAGIFWTLTTGGRLVLTERRNEQDLDRLAKTISECTITHTLLLPTLYSVLVKHIPAKDLASLETVIVAGEQCPASLPDEHFKTLPDVKLYNEYGPTEGTVWATAYRITPGDAGQRIPVGEPIHGTRIYLLDENLKKVPVGVKGEIYIGGNGVAGGYINDPLSSAERFIPDPFSRAVNGRLYRTGDIGRYRNDGKIEFLGRIDDQVKIRGYRVEPGEIAEVIKRVPGVNEVFVKPSVTERTRSSNNNSETDNLREKLLELKPEAADEILRSVEKLGGAEIGLILGEMEQR